MWQHAAYTTDQLSSPNCWTVAIQKSVFLNEKYWRIFWKKFRRKGQQAENDKTERVTGLGRRTREEIAKWNQMTALRSQTGGRHQTFPASLWGKLLRRLAAKNPLCQDNFCRKKHTHNAWYHIADIGWWWCTNSKTAHKGALKNGKQLGKLELDKCF